MLTLRDIDSLIQFDKLDKSHKEDLSFVFKTYGKKAIIIYPDGGLLTYKRFLNHSVSSYDSVSFDVHMFINAYSLYKNTDIVGVKDKSGKLIGVITDALSSYFHPYQNDGGLDMWFLNQYDCMFLHGVNEGMGNEYLDQYSSGYHCLHIIEGIPHLEDPKRFNLGISYYDEVLSFTYMFSEMHSYGEENPDYHFCIIDMPYNNLGLFGLRDKAICVARYIKACGYIPVFYMAHFYKGSYKNNSSLLFTTS